METTIFEIEFNDSRKFRVFCANRTQTLKTLQKYNELLTRGEAKSIKDLVNGIHTHKQFNQIIKSIYP